MGILWPRSSSLEWDDDGELAEGALAYFYNAGTSTPKAVYTDGDESVAHEFPVEADGARWPAVFVPYGSYKFIIKTAAGTTLFSADDVPNEAPNDEESVVDGDALYQTGDLILAGKNGSRPGAVRCNGKTIGNAASGGTERANADTADLFAYLWNNYTNMLTISGGGAGASAAADYAANKTIAMPDYRGCAIGSFSDMGNSDNGNYIFAPVIIGSGILAGSRMGEYTHALTTAELATHLHTVSITSENNSADHTHLVSGTSGGQSVTHTHSGTTTTTGSAHTHTISDQNSGTITNNPGVGPFTTTGAGTNWGPLNGETLAADSGGTHTHTFTSGDASVDHTHSISITSGNNSAAHTHAVAGNTGNNGSGTAHNIIQPTALVTVLMKL
jgi:hypothetical protein